MGKYASNDDNFNWDIGIQLYSSNNLYLCFFCALSIILIVNSVNELSFLHVKEIDSWRETLQTL